MDSPPYYILISNQNQSSSSSSSSSTALTHPVIQYHYADDSPIALLPRFPEERVIVLDADSSSSTPIVRSLSEDIVATGLRTAEASGAAVDEGGPPRDDRMYIIETTAKDEKVPDQMHKSPQAILAQFKQRNIVLRRALVYPDAKE